MSGGITTRSRVDFRRKPHGRKVLKAVETPKPEPRAGIPRVSRLLALAIRLEALVQSGEVTDYAELARLGMVRRARMTQIMGLLHLAPDIQEQILFLPPASRGREAVTERQLRPIVAELDWGVQRRMWAAMGWL